MSLLTSMRILGVALALSACTAGADKDTAGRDADGDGFLAEADGGDDCDDADAAINPDAAEVCDGVDNDCDGEDEDADAIDALSGFSDADGDTHGDGESPVRACDPSSGVVESSDDCDDSSAAIYPGADETCDGLDDDCDGAIDEDAVDVGVWYLDEDEDGYGVDESTVTACDQPSGYAAQGGDCDDADAAINLGATEVCDGIDNDCDGAAENDDAVDAQVWYRDADGDGYGGTSGTHVACEQPSGYAGTDDDCDDADATVSPGGTEVCDGKDNDCDGLDEDTDAIDAGTWYADADADGYGDAADATVACDAPTGTVDNGDDCDDMDDAINPGVAEICDDTGVDDDCDGIALSGEGGIWYDDSDGDGFGDPATGVLICEPPDGAVLVADDCDDADLAVYPGAPEACGDGVVNDCDADPDAVDATCPLSGTVSLADADAIFVGEATGDYAGISVVGAGDVDGDGNDDLMVGAYGESTAGVSAGAAYLVLGPVSGTVDLSDADAKFTGENANDLAGFGISNAGDVDGDGLGDLLIGAQANDAGATDAGAVYLIYGAVTGTMGLSDADAKLVGEAASDNTGFSMASAGDVNGDGDADLMVGSLYQDEGATDGGAVYLVTGPVTGTLDLSDADAKYLAENAGDYAGFSVWGPGDVDGDGGDDLLIGAVDENTGGTVAGAAYLILSPSAGTLDLADADAKMIGEAAGDNAGNWVGSPVDEDGDGYNDLIITACVADTGSRDGGATYLVLGPLTGTLDLSAADAVLVAESAADYVGVAASGAGDVNGDGRGDLFVGAYGVDAGGSEAGASYLVLAPISGTMGLGDAQAKLIGENAGDYAGYAVAGNADINGDGYGDMLTGAYTADRGGMLSGVAYLTLGPGGG